MQLFDINKMTRAIKEERLTLGRGGGGQREDLNRCHNKGTHTFPSSEGKLELLTKS